MYDAKSWPLLTFHDSGVTAYNRPMPIFVYEFNEKTFVNIFVSNICNYYLYFHIPLVWFESEDIILQKQLRFPEFTQ